MTVPIDAADAKLIDYVLVLSDPNKTDEEEMCAVSDMHAVGLAQKKYPTSDWTLYRREMAQRVAIYSNGQA